MSNKLKELRAKEGFTIIEVIIVLVIGAVIMLAVFLVVPQLQRTQRNSNRQNAARRVLTASEQYASNNNGTYPAFANGSAGSATNCGANLTAADCPPVGNITGTVNAPNGTAYTLTQTIDTTTTNNIIGPNAMFALNGTSAGLACDAATNKIVTTGGTAGKVAIGVLFETSASVSRETFCVSN
jgi:prepilin-type N-terminal cleavage/methylation domain-containing protein